MRGVEMLCVRHSRIQLQPHTKKNANAQYACGENEQKAIRRRRRLFVGLLRRWVEIVFGKCAPDCKPRTIGVFEGACIFETRRAKFHLLCFARRASRSFQSEMKIKCLPTQAQCNCFGLVFNRETHASRICGGYKGFFLCWGCMWLTNPSSSNYANKKNPTHTF